MKSKILAVLAFIPSLSMAQSVYEPTPDKDGESNVGCMSSNCISSMELDNRNLPMIRVAPSFTTRLKFPREVVKCEDDTDTLKICDADRPKDCDENSAKQPAGRAKPFLQARVKVMADPAKVVGSIFSLPPVNVLCDFANGDTITFYAKVSPNPHHIVRFTDKEPELSGLAWLFSRDPKGRVVPIELSPKKGSAAPATLVKFDDGSGRSSNASETEVLEKLFAEKKQ